MKKTQKIALSGIFSALSVVIMLSAYFPYVTYAAPALAGVLFAVITIEAGRKWAFGSYAVSSIIVLLICEKESAVLFVGFFGYYVILKGIIEQYFKGAVERILKHSVFSVSVIAGYFIITRLLGIPFSEEGFPEELLAAVMLLLGNIVFAVYDVGLSRVIGLYINNYHSKISKIFK